MKQRNFYLWSCWTAVLILLLADDADAFGVLHPRRFGDTRSGVSVSSSRRGSSFSLDATQHDNDVKTEQQEQEELVMIEGVVAPLKYLGPYPCLTLRFPEEQAPAVDFMLDTGANINSIDSQCFQDYFAETADLMFDSHTNHIVGSAGVGGKFAAGDLYDLGDAVLDGLPPPDLPICHNFTAAVLPHASAVGKGILGQLFLMQYPGGVEFDWYGTDGDPPTIILHFTQSLSAETLQNTKAVPFQRLTTQVMAFNLTLNEKITIPALLDTGAPMTVLSPEVATAAGISYYSEQDDDSSRDQQHPPSLDNKVLTVGGIDGKHMSLYRSKAPVSMTSGNNEVNFGSGHVFVGELPGLQLLNAYGETTIPKAIFGLDALRQNIYRMIIHGCENQLLFEELKNEEDTKTQKL